MAIIRASGLHLSYGNHVLLDDASFKLEAGDRVCLVGRNGAGKSTLLKLVDQSIALDSGEIWRSPTAIIARLDQELPSADDRSVLQVVASGLAELGALLADFDQLSHQHLDERGLNQLAQLQHEIEARDGWLFQQKIDEVITRLDLPRDKAMSSLSGGWRRRVALAAVLVTDPDLLLLDEPTNHLDIETIEWLERQLIDFKGALLFITHDRALVQRLATRVIELDRGKLRAFNCGYDKFLEERAHLLVVEDQQNALFDKRLAEEETWIRQGVKARRTRNEGRVRALERMRAERSERRVQTGTAKIAVDGGSSSGKLVAELKNVSFSYDGNILIDDFTGNIIRGDKIGLIGPNGVGKTTLLKIILGELAPTSGEIKLGTKLDVAYFDQMREMLDGDKTIVDTVGQGRDSIEINGKSRHIMSYLSDFLFSPQRARTPLRALSGGERSRVQLACLFSQPVNILVLDEPTNDLDIETLELLETVLVDFKGTVLLVSHDRAFMDNVIGSSLAFEGRGKVREYVGGYHDWLRQGGAFNDEAATGIKKVEATVPGASEPQKQSKLSYKLERELGQLPAKIEKLEQGKAEIEHEVASESFYQQEQGVISSQLEKLAAVSTELESCYERWVELSE